jgi:hypothetical protein
MRSARHRTPQDQETDRHEVRSVRKSEGELLPEQKRVSQVRAGDPQQAAGEVVATRDHEVIRQWAARRQAEPATGEATASGPATVDVNDGGAGIRFNFPGVGLFRPISWDEWFSIFDRNAHAFVYENDPAGAPPGYRYRIVRAPDWTGVLE